MEFLPGLLGGIIGGLVTAAGAIIQMRVSLAIVARDLHYLRRDVDDHHERLKKVEVQA